MVPWNWNLETVTPEDILDAAKTMPATDMRIVMNLTQSWVAATRYLEWACAALHRGGDDGWDTASSLAKRAVCRRMDSILAHNHLGCFHTANYKKKAEYLAELKIPGLLLVRNSIIDPRNDIEHAYELATEDHARNACEAAQLFLSSTNAEAEQLATVTLGWTANIRVSSCTVNGKEHLVVKIDLTKAHPPAILITDYPETPQVWVMLPEDETVRTCPLKSFCCEQAIRLNALLRDHSWKGCGITYTFGPQLMALVKDQVIPPKG